MTQTLSPQATIAQLEAENAQLRRENAQLWQERTWVEQVLAVPHDILSASHKITLIALKKELLDHAADEQGYREIETWKVVKSTGTSKDTVLSSIERGKQIGLLDKRKRRIQHAPGEYTTDFYVKENALLNYPEHYQAQGELFRKHGGKQQPKAACVYCGSEDLDRYEAQYCRACKETHFIPLEVAPDPWEKRQVANTDEPAESTADSIGNLPPFPSPTVERQVANTEPERLLTHACLPPAWLLERRIWCCHREKVPYIAELARMPQKAKSNDAATWRTYDETQAIYELSLKERWKYPYSGIGFMCDGSFTVIDYDHCVTDGMIEEQIQSRIYAVHSYGELSYSETGVHQIARGTIPRGVKRPEIEMYCTGRFLTWTGKHLVSTPGEVVDSQSALDVLFAEIAPPSVAAPQLSIRIDNLSYSHSDTEILEKARNDAKFMKLWEGDQAYIAATYPKKDGSPDYSRADQALCKKLSYWGAGGDVSTIDRLFRQSRLYRPKWERDDYRNSTIARAIGEQERRAS